MTHKYQSLIDAAIAARLAAYAPYSKFQVGAALLCGDGEIVTGCNVENLSYGLTICAERNAIFTAVAAGRQKFAAIAIAADTEKAISPCGACRQVMCEFGDFPVMLANLHGELVESSVSELLPRGQTGILGRD
ncbi:MAG: cytidine deaminase [Verrucomicrobiales bacterium]|jgi:cytidine deaminase